MLATELPSLPNVLADAVRAYFETLTRWITSVLEKGGSKGDLKFDGEPRATAEWFVANVHGAMLSARALSDPFLFRTITDQTMARFR